METKSILVYFLLLLDPSKGSINITSYKYYFSQKYLPTEFAIFQNTSGKYFYNATRIFTTNKVLRIVVRCSRNFNVTWI